LYYNRFRYYDPEDGIYISLDPIGLAGGMNAYKYIYDINNWVDRLGLSGECNSTEKGIEIIAANGTKINGFIGHAVERAIERGVSPSSMLDALKNPLKIGEVVFDNLGRPSQRLIGRSSEVVINPLTGRIISVNPTSSKKAARLLTQKGR
jgi:hypothetical protein